MEYRAEKILDQLKSILTWYPQHQDTALYREIRVLIRYYELNLLEE